MCKVQELWSLHKFFAKGRWLKNWESMMGCMYGYRDKTHLKSDESAAHLLGTTENFDWASEFILYLPRNLHAMKYEPPHDKTNKMACAPSEDLDQTGSLGIRPVWSESLLSTWTKLGSLATHWAHSKDSDQTGWMPRLIWVFTGRTVTLLVLSRCGSYIWRKWWVQVTIQKNLDTKNTFQNYPAR